MNKKTVKDIQVENKKVIVRCDFNVPLDKDGNIVDNRRIVSALPTIKYLIENNAKIILISHLGRPKGQRKEEFSLKPVAKELKKLLNKDVKLSNELVGENVKNLVNNMNNGEVILLENIRFDSREEKNDKEFSKQLASLGEIFVNDAFGTSHRAHSSTAGIAEFLPAVSGFLIEKEITFLGSALENPKKPFAAILGGAKVSDKIVVIENLLKKVDVLIIGGGMAFTFFKAQGKKIGDSICENDKLELAKKIIKEAKEKNVDLVLPIDANISTEFSNEAENKIIEEINIPEGWQGLDIGPKTIKLFNESIKNAKTIIWNGPLGVCEFTKFKEGTRAIAKAIANIDCISIVGGGDSAGAIEKLGLANKFTHISTGGGTSLEFLEGKKLPGIECLENK